MSHPCRTCRTRSLLSSEKEEKSHRIRCPTACGTEKNSSLYVIAVGSCAAWTLNGSLRNRLLAPVGETKARESRGSGSPFEEVRVRAICRSVAPCKGVKMRPKQNKLRRARSAKECNGFSPDCGVSATSPWVKERPTRKIHFYVW
ncbi:hypothetical protein SKAU_G00211930 [Synaphobranchus kaupii]|uniref:Uncharacterized protein n=1 Tax=Synaphobranchus kaupii TaxID=118154 RepID=A0A9Q1IV04_SYNKA|nr:hypothetical protein SKAU_G00211930 [Synaphobranchus kaupii]